MPYGTRVGAAGVGVTEFAGWNSGGYGNLVVIRHRLGYTTWYAHLSRITTWVGESVTGGTRIGYVGATGHATGPHLHFELRRNAVPIDPVPYLLAAVATRASSARRERGAGARPAVAGAGNGGGEGGGSPEAASPPAPARSESRSSVTGEHRSTPARRRTCHAPADATRLAAGRWSALTAICAVNVDTIRPAAQPWVLPFVGSAPRVGDVRRRSAERALRGGTCAARYSADVSDPRAIACRSSALSSVSSSTPFSSATSRIVRADPTASCTISVPRS